MVRFNTEDTRTYDAGGRLSTSAYRNGVTATYAYRSSGGSKDNFLDSISFTHPGGLSTAQKVGTYSYTWDGNKNKTKETISGQISGYSFDTTLGSDPDGYDDEDRLTYYKRSSVGSPQTWTLTAVGDWSSWSDFGTSQSRTHGGAHEILTAGSSPNHTIVHDVKGNITDIPTNIASPARELFWDFDNRLTGVDNTGDSTPDVTYAYDALGRRVSRTESSATVVYVSAGQQVIADYSSGSSPTSTPLYRYVWGDYIDEPILRQTGSSSLRYYHHNQQFSTIALTNFDGEVIERYAYTAYGKMDVLTASGTSRAWSTNANRYTYTGREWDDTSMMFYFRARWYEPVLGRFMGRDPVGYVDGPSQYLQYFSLSRTDPSGKSPCKGNCHQLGSSNHVVVDVAFDDPNHGAGPWGREDFAETLSARMKLLTLIYALYKPGELCEGILQVIEWGVHTGVETKLVEILKQLHLESRVMIFIKVKADCCRWESCWEWRSGYCGLPYRQQVWIKWSRPWEYWYKCHWIAAEGHEPEEGFDPTTEADQIALAIPKCMKEAICGFDCDHKTNLQ